MDHQEYERLRMFYKKQPDEVLLDFIQNQYAEFLPEALDLIRAELADRGIRMEDVPHSAPGPSDTEHVGDGNVGPEPLVSVAHTNSRNIAIQAQDILEQEGILSHVSDTEIGGRTFPGTPHHGALQILVSPHDMERAKAILDTFPPLAPDG